jgi:hypothetical protein
MLASGSLVAQLVAGKATRDALFLTHFGLDALPAAMMAGAALSAISVVLMSRALVQSGPARVVPATFAASSLLFLSEWALSWKSERATAVLVYAHLAVVGTAIGSAFWSLINERFDPHEAKRLVGRIASGGTIGGAIGGLLVWRASAHLSITVMLALLAAVNLLGLWGSIKIPPQASLTASPAPALVTTGGLDVLRKTSYLRDLAMLVAAGAIVQALLDWLLSAHATQEYGQGPKLLGFFALFNMIVSVLSFAAQTGLTRVVIERRGLGGTIKLQPMSLAAGILLAIVVPHFYTVLVARVIESVTRSSLYRSAYELFYTPLPNAKKRATKALIDVGVDRLGTALGSAALFAVGQTGSANTLAERLALHSRIVLFALLALTAVAMFIAARLQQGYVAALASSLKSGAVSLDVDEELPTKNTLAETSALLDRDRLLAHIEQFQRHKESLARSAAEPAAPASHAVAVTVHLTSHAQDDLVARIEALRSNDVPRIRRALGGVLTPELAAWAIPLLANDAVVRDAVRALRKAAPKITGMLVDRLLDPELDLRVRRRIPRVLKACRSQRAASGLLLGLHDPVFDVRVQVALALAQIAPEPATVSLGEGIVLDTDAILDRVRSELTTGRSSWDANDVRRGLDHVFVMLGLALPRESLSIAYRALRGGDPSLRGTAFEYLEVVLPAPIRELLVPLLGDVKPGPRTRERGRKELADELLRSRG